MQPRARLGRQTTWRSDEHETAASPKAKRASLLSLLAAANASLFAFWNSLTEALRTGRPQNEAKSGSNFFELVYTDPQRLGEFAKAMTAISMRAAHVIATAFPWDRYQTVIDVGCAEGCVPAQIALADEHISGGGVDLPPVEPLFDAYVAQAGLGERLRFHAGDFFADPLPDGGALIVYDAIIDDERREHSFGLLVSLNMLIESPGGFDYTVADCQGWLRGAGFAETYTQRLAGPDSMVVGIK